MLIISNHTLQLNNAQQFTISIRILQLESTHVQQFIISIYIGPMYQFNHAQQFITSVRILQFNHAQYFTQCDHISLHNYIALSNPAGHLTCY